MIIEFSRTGGVTGMRLITKVNTDELPETEAEQLKGLVAKADTATQKPTKRAGIDRFQYQLKFKKGRKAQVIALTDGQHSELVQYMTEKAMSQAV